MCLSENTKPSRELDAQGGRQILESVRRSPHAGDAPLELCLDKLSCLTAKMRYIFIYS
jgi:hypothetical protein